MNNLLQHLRSMASQYAKKGVPYLENIEACSHFPKFKEALENLKLADLNIPYDRKYLYNPDEPLKYLKIVDEENLGMGMFFFPKRKEFYAEDHPNMFVATKILDGTLLSHSYHFLETEKAKHLLKILSEGRENEPEYAKDFEESLLADYSGTKNMNTGEIEYLTPLNLNLHRVQAEYGDCAMLEIFIPNSSHRHFTESADEDKDQKVKLKVLVKGRSFSSIKW